MATVGVKGLNNNVSMCKLLSRLMSTFGATLVVHARNDDNELIIAEVL